MAVADLDRLAEVERERDRLSAWKREAMLLFDGLQDLGRALDLPLGTLVTGPSAIEAAGALRAQRDAVVALADGWCEVPDYSVSEYDRGRVDQRHDMTTELLGVLNGVTHHGRRGPKQAQCHCCGGPLVERDEQADGLCRICNRLTAGRSPRQVSVDE